MIRRARGPRQAAVNLLTLLALPALVLLAGLVFHVALLRAARTEVQNGADAAALAAAHELATDELLHTNPDASAGRIRRARQAADRLADANLAAGERIRLEPNPDNTLNGDVVFGHLDAPLSGTFTPAGGDPASWSGTRLNAVRVTARRPAAAGLFGGPERDVLARATAMLDFSVVGFRPSNDDPIPLIPVAVFTDHHGGVPHAWYAHSSHPGPGGAPDVTVALGVRKPRAAAVPGAFLRIGVRSFRETAEQCREGVRRRHLNGVFGGDFVLGPANILTIPGSPDCPPEGTTARRLIEAALEDVRRAGSPRIWPLYSGVDETGAVRVSGWTAARLVAVRPHDGGLALTLRPAVLPHTAAVTERRPSPPAFWANNRTVCRVRLAE